jgi:hypothetical protein
MGNAGQVKVSGQYGCSVDGCPGTTDGFYCAEHAVICEDCGEEAERGTLVNGRCEGCLRRGLPPPGR